VYPSQQQQQQQLMLMLLNCSCTSVNAYSSTLLTRVPSLTARRNVTSRRPSICAIYIRLTLAIDLCPHLSAVTRSGQSVGRSGGACSGAPTPGRASLLHLRPRQSTSSRTFTHAPYTLCTVDQNGRRKLHLVTSRSRDVIYGTVDKHGDGRTDGRKDEPTTVW